MDDLSGLGGDRRQLRAGWYAVSRARDLGAGPKRVWFHDRPYVLWRKDTQVVAQLDMCPHRGAPLSMGRVIDGEIACPYHGWRFNDQGRCTHMPALDGPPTPAGISGLAAAESNGLIFVGWRVSPQAPLPDLPVTPLIERSACVIMAGEVSTTLADFAENILDTTHTSVVHGGYLRGTEGRRPVTPEIAAGADWIEARYLPAATPDGFMGRFIGSKGYHITDRFRAPNMTEVEYRQDGRIVFAVRFHLTPTVEDKVMAFAVMSVAGRSWLAWTKVRVLQYLFGRIIAEDRTILNAVSANRRVVGRSPVYIAPQDVLRAGIDAILRGDTPLAPAAAPALRV